MNLKILNVAAAGAVVLSSVSPGLAAGKTKCSSILAVCMQRASGQVAICEDMYRSALSNGYWQKTQEPDGTEHAAVPCTK